MTERMVPVSAVVVPADRDRQAGDVADLLESIQAVGLLHPPAVTPDLILVAGLRRLTAVKRLGWAEVPVTVVESLPDAVAVLRAELDENTARRDLSPVEAARARARRVAVLKPLVKPGRTKRNAGQCPAFRAVEDDVPRGQVRDVAAIGLGISGRRLDDVDDIVATAGDDSQPEPVREAAQAAVEALSKPGGRIAREKKKIERAKRDAALAAAPPPTPPLDLGAFPVLYVDPPWRYDHMSAPDSRQIENHYPTMNADELQALRLPAAADAVLLMWATSPKLAEAIDLMRVWDFEYRTCMVWVKDKIGMGYYARQRHELLLIGRRGNGAVPDEDRRPDSVQQHPRGAHSAKPHAFYDLIDHMWPGLPKVELFARNTRPGWASWGNQV